MNETAAIVALGILTVVVIVALVALWRRPAATLEDIDGAERFPECPPEAIGHIFGSADLAFLRTKVAPELRRAFERERRGIALNWVWHAFDESRGTMSAHFKAARSSPDLRLSREALVVAEFMLHQVMCLAMIGALRATGPIRLARAAEGVEYLRRQMATGLALSSSAVPDEMPKRLGF